jgi:glutamate dehydrogenase/leucine dehydrogenase
MDQTTIVALLGIIVTNAGGLVAAYVAITNRLTRHHERIKRLEDANDDLTHMVREVVETVHEIRRLLAANQIK